jgi:hypothetical protein
MGEFSIAQAYLKAPGEGKVAKLANTTSAAA